MERAKDDDQQGHHRDERSMVARVGFFEENEAGEKKGNQDTDSSETDLQRVELKAHRTGNCCQITREDQERMGDSRRSSAEVVGDSFEV